MTRTVLLLPAAVLFAVGVTSRVKPIRLVYSYSPSGFIYADVTNFSVQCCAVRTGDALGLQDSLNTYRKRQRTVPSIDLTEIKGSWNNQLIRTILIHGPNRCDVRLHTFSMSITYCSVSSLLIVAIYLLVAGLILLRMEMRKNRRKREPLCGHCQYDIRVNTTGRCPECGATVAGQFA